jgi:PIN domain nuclease of toxin-antitoxin system
VASLWELVIKQVQGRPDFNVQPAVLRRDLLDGGWLELPIEAHHALAVAALPPLYRDPFGPAAARPGQRRGFAADHR